MFYDANPALVFEKIAEKLKKICLWAFLFGGIAVILAASNGSSTRVSADEIATYDLAVDSRPGVVEQVHVVLEVRGELRMNPDGTQVTQLPLLVTGRLQYEEISESGVKRDIWAKSARYYETAKAEIRIDGKTLTSELGQDRRSVFVQSGSDETHFFTAGALLTRDELELVDVQGNSHLLQFLLPGKPAALGEVFTIDDDKLARVLGLDLLTKNEMQCRLVNVEEKIAMFEAAGAVIGAVGGIHSELEITAKYNFDRQRRRISWFAAHIKETRAIGHAEPGFEVEARLRLATLPLERPKHLTNDQLAALRTVDEPTRSSLVFKPASGTYQILHDTRWRAMLDRHDVSILRLVDRGDLIAQCNISELPKRKQDERLSLAEFQRDVQKSLGDNFEQLLEASEYSAANGNRILRAVASGTASGLPIQWIYYHIGNDAGASVALAFTLEEKLVERLAEADRQIVESLEFAP